jgi:large subunit ribosomal protein L24e
MECSFCGREIRKGLESNYVTSKGKIHSFCSSKCEKNMLKLRRNKRNVKWTEEYRREKEARLKLLKQGVPQEKIKELEKAAEQAKPEGAVKTAGEQKPSSKPQEPSKQKKKEKK